MTKRSVTCAALGFLAASATLCAQPKTFATGLIAPAKIILGPAGTLLVSEFDSKQAGINLDRDVEGEDFELQELERRPSALRIHHRKISGRSGGEGDS
jgi:hypothetical protein